ncbi:helix-turn-helix domain-containing protein [Paenibacillus enshidis]|uniref:Helix-turn-helix domain-containing protein n=1 Tax=Paenibacillus enshidis TaxID=1458439 RepID=A0ABV5B1P6_9BACL
MKNAICIIDINENFTCTCGNTSIGEGFFPCDRNGNYTDPSYDWTGFYKCRSCEQIIKTMKEYINLVDTAKLIGVTPASLYKIVNHDDLEKRLEPINRTTHRGDGGFRFRLSDVQRYIEKYVKKDLTSAETAQRIGRSVTFVHKLIRDGRLPSYEDEYRGKRTYFIKPKDLEQYIDDNPDTGKVPTIYDKRLRLFLFQPFINDDKLARVFELKRVNNRKVEAVIITEDGEQLSYEAAIEQGWKPQKTIAEKKPINGYGYALFEFPPTKRIDSIVYSVIETLFEHAGPSNMRIVRSEEKIIVEVRKCVLKGIMPATHPDLIKELGVFMQSGKVIPKYDGTVIDTGLLPIQAFLTEEEKQDLIAQANVHNMSLQEWVEYRLTEDLPHKRRRD